MQVLGVLLSLVTFSSAFPIWDSLFSRADPLCNGYAALCNRKYSNITFIGNHNSAFVGELPSQNQEKSVKDQLGGGIRFLQSQTHLMFDAVLAMCHTECALTFGGLVIDYLRIVKKFLDDNPREVVTLLFTNPDGAPMEKYDEVYKAVGLDKMSFKPASSPNPLPMDQWPTLGEMISKNQRLVTFIDYGADEKKVPYLLDEFNYYWETPFSTTDIKFPQCSIDRKNKVDGSGKTSMNIVNHSHNINIFNTGVIVPDRDNADKVNAVSGESSLGARAALCSKTHGRNPNVLLIDYFGRGDAIGAQKMLNGL